MRRAFTLVELIIVMLILAALAGAVIPAFTANQAQARAARIRADLEAIKSAMYVYRADTGIWPATIGALSGVGGAVPGYNGPYLDTSTPYSPCYPGSGATTSYEYSYSVGPPRTVQRNTLDTSCPATTVQVAQN